MKTAQKTRDRLLDAAENLFAERGIDGASMRGITSRAGTNLAAVNYHFGSKDGLLRTLLEDRVNPINARRIELLTELETNGDLTIEGVLRALITPAVDTENPTSDSFLQLMTRIHHSTDPVSVDVMEKVFGQVAERYFTAFAKLLPNLSPQALCQRMQFVIGSMLHSLFSKTGTNCPVTSVIGNPDDLRLDDAAYVDEFVTFCAAGMRA